MTPACLSSSSPLWGLAGVALGVVLGWYLNRRSASAALIEQQRRNAAGDLLDALVEARLHASVLSERTAAREKLAVAKDECRRAVLRYSGRVGDEELTDRVGSIVFVLHLAHMGGTDETGSKPAEAGVNLGSLAYIVERAFLDAFVCLDAFLNGEKLPPRSFPPQPISIAADDSREGDAVDRLRAELNEWPEPDRTARTRIMFGL